MQVAPFLAALLAATSAFGSDFRGHAWGDHMDAVTATHGTPIERSSGLLVYEKPVAGERTFITFAFDQERLVQGSYFLHLDAPHTGQAMASYQALHQLLAARYGQANMDQIWRRAGKPDLDPEFEIAVASGDLQLLSRWLTRNAELRHVLRGERFEVDHGLVYSMPGMV